MPATGAMSRMKLKLSFSTTIGYIKGGSLRALAVTTAARSQALPDIPAVAESVPGYEASASYGLGAPINTPVEIVAILNQETTRRWSTPECRRGLPPWAVLRFPARLPTSSSSSLTKLRNGRRS
jgi:hypothetical protein